MRNVVARTISCALIACAAITNSEEWTSWTGPLAANGTLYAFIRGQLYAIGEKGPEEAGQPLDATDIANDE